MTFPSRQSHGSVFSFPMAGDCPEYIEIRQYDFSPGPLSGGHRPPEGAFVFPSLRTVVVMDNALAGFLLNNQNDNQYTIY